MSLLRAAFHSDIGRVRKENQDRCLCDSRLGLYGVADGVSGLPGGAIAAQVAIEALVSSIEALPQDKEPDLLTIVQGVHRAVAYSGTSVSPGMGIATTLTASWIGGNKIAIAHVGDSRCYLWADGRLERLTEDHSVENEFRRRREAGEEVPAYDPASRRALVRCLGIEPDCDPDVTVRTLRPGDRYLFCTDGVTNMITEQTLALLLSSPEEPHEIVSDIVASALKRGGYDNASAVLVIVDEA